MDSSLTCTPPSGVPWSCSVVTQAGELGVPWGRGLPRAAVWTQEVSDQGLQHPQAVVGPRAAQARKKGHLSLDPSHPIGTWPPVSLIVAPMALKAIWFPGR